MPELLKTSELAARLRVSAYTVGVWVRSGRITPVRLSRNSLRFDLAAVLKQLDATAPKNSAPAANANGGSA